MNSHQDSSGKSAYGAATAKLMDSAAHFRRERDDAHRRMGLAQERLRLAKEEDDAAEKSTFALKKKLEELESKSGAEAQKAIEQLKVDVQSLTNQVSVSILIMEDGDHPLVCNNSRGCSF
jgi:chromosome segregation ATPase